MRNEIITLTCVHGLPPVVHQALQNNIGGCHADEPVGPMLLESLVRYLHAAPPESEVLTRFDWWVVPHIADATLHHLGCDPRGSCD